MRQYRKVIAINEATGERKEFESVYAARKALGTSSASVVISLGVGTAVKGWKVYDSPENIRKRIAELEAQIKMLESK